MSTDYDPELLAEFIAETRESLATTEDFLIRIENDPSDRAAIEGMFRHLHTIKGTAGFFGLSPLKSLAHQLENLLDTLRSNKLVINTMITGVLLRGLDTMNSIIVKLENGILDHDALWNPAVPLIVCR